MRKVSTWLPALAFLPSVCMAEGLYRVEIIVFAQPTESTDLIRHFEAAPSLELARAVDFRRYFCLPAQREPGFMRHFRSEEDVADCLSGYLRLNELRQPMVAERIRLEKSGQYRILHHAAWQQPVSSPDEALPVRLTNGKTLAQASSEAPALDGSVRLSREQFLQLDLELLYHYPASAPDGDPAASDGLLLQLNRKLRPGDLNYLDHPVIGILAQVTPVEEEPLALETGQRTRIAFSTR